MRHRSSSPEDSPRGGSMVGIQEWVKQRQRVDLVQSWLLIYRHTESGQPCDGGLRAGKEVSAFVAWEKMGFTQLT